MNFEKVLRKNRKAISPVLATVILIAITLIAAIAIAGFVFGLFGTFTSGQNMQLVGATCTSGATGTCVLQITNTGGASASITGCTIYGATGAVTSSPVTVAAGTTSATPVSVTCTPGATTTLTSGAQVTGTLIVASGSPLTFSAIAQ